MSDKCGSKEWLKQNAWFAGEYCEAADETTVHRPADLKRWDGKTICDDCWSGLNDEDLPDRWTDLNPFEPFACLDEQQQLDALATEVLRASHHGDQHFIQCLAFSDPATTRLRLAIVALADFLREQS